jgi:hypothetical protein
LSVAKVQCFTSASFAYFDRVRVLGETLRRHHPDWTLSLCLSDTEPPGFTLDLSKEPIDNVVPITDLAIPDLPAWIFKHDVVELCTAVKGQMLCRLLEEGADKVVYLDPDIAVLGDLSEIERLLDDSSIILTPHLVEPETEHDAILDNEIGALKHGIYNLGFLAVANRPEGRRFATWWRDRLLEFCYDDVPNGLFTDQRWCDHIPGFFSGVHILRDPGYNVASWNLGQRPLTIGSDGSIRVAGRLLRFFHFTKVTWVGELMLERYSRDRIEVFELMHWYREMLAKSAVSGLPANWWGFGRYFSGASIPRSHRIAYRTQPRLKELFPDPFSSGSHSLEAFLNAGENRETPDEVVTSSI